MPRAGERLAEPVWLPHCGTWLVEWRATPTLRAETTASEQAEAVMDGTCKDAFERYGDFLDRHRLPHPRAHPDAMPQISLLPANVLRDGRQPRALNDLPTRFGAAAPGCCYWGLYIDGLHHLFLRNDPLVRDSNGHLLTNPRFVRTLTHELSHVLSSRLGVWDAVGYDRQRDEDLAEEFVAFMGIHFPADTSDQDLALHGDVPDLPAANAKRPAEVAATKGATTRPQRVPASTSPQR
ncbi:MAG: hypothetical protein ACRENE_02385 [Polyangiaceae bacterium]